MADSCSSCSTSDEEDDAEEHDRDFVVSNECCDVGVYICCGHEHYQQLGIGGKSESVPLPVCSASLRGLHLEEVACGLRHTLLRTASGQVYACGSNSFGQLGLGRQSGPASDGRPQLLRELADQGENVVRVACGNNHSVVLSSVGHVYTFGIDGHNQLGREGSCFRPLRVREDLDSITVVDVAAGNDHTVAVSDDGKVFAWGRGAENQLGFEALNYVAPRLVTALSGVLIRRIECGQLFCVAMDSENNLWSWGDNSRGQCGRGPDRAGQGSSAPRQIRSLRDKTITEFFCGWKHAGAVTSDGQLFVWGDNRHGQLGLNLLPLFVNDQPTGAGPDLNDAGVGEPASSPPLSSSSSQLLVVPPTLAGSSEGIRDAGSSRETTPTGSARSRSGTNSPARRGSCSSHSHLEYYPRLVTGPMASQVVVQASGAWRHTVALTNHGDVFVTGTDAYGSLGLGDSRGGLARRAQAGCFTPLVMGRNVVSAICGGEHTVCLAESVRTMPLARDLRVLQASGFASDVLFLVTANGGAQFPAHKFVLAARAPALLRLVNFSRRRRLAAGLSGNERVVVRLTQCSPTAFELLLLFVYGDDLAVEPGQCHENPTVCALVNDVRRLAVQFGLSRLVSLCARALHSGGARDAGSLDALNSAIGESQLRKDMALLLQKDQGPKGVEETRSWQADVLLQVTEGDGEMVGAHKPLLVVRAAGFARAIGLTSDIFCEHEEEEEELDFDSNGDELGDDQLYFNSKKQRGDNDGLAPVSVSHQEEEEKEEEEEDDDDDEEMAVEAVFVDNVDFKCLKKFLKWLYCDKHVTSDHDQDQCHFNNTGVFERPAARLLDFLAQFETDEGTSFGRPAQPFAALKQACVNDIVFSVPAVGVDTAVECWQLAKRWRVNRLAVCCQDLLIEGLGLANDSKAIETLGLDSIDKDSLYARIAQTQPVVEDGESFDGGDQLGRGGGSFISRAKGFLSTKLSKIGKQ